MDSVIMLAEITVQTMSGALVVTTIGATDVSAASASITTLIVGTARVSGGLNVATLVAATANITGNLHVVGDVSVSGSIDFPGRSEGEVFIEVTAVVSASVAFVDAVTTATAFSVFLVDFEVTAGSLKYTGTQTKNFMTHATLNLECSANNIDTHIRIAIDGSALARLESGKEIGTTENELTTAGLVRLATGERVSVQINSEDANAKGYTIHDLILTVRE